MNKKSMQYRLHSVAQCSALLQSYINPACTNLAGALKFIYINVNHVLLCTHKLHFRAVCNLPHLMLKKM